MSTNSQFNDFRDGFEKTLSKQTGLSLGEWSALVLSGQDPTQPSDCKKFIKRLKKRRKKGKDIDPVDIDELLHLIDDHMAYQALSGQQRTQFARSVIAKLVPQLTTADLDMMTEREVSNIMVTDEFREKCIDMMKDAI